jgi:FtsP/CotA-like multicopper oxidase with cupredoxin domain
MAQYNNLWIPDTLSGTTFNLTIKDTFSQIRTGQQTITGGVNNKFWGPTLFVNKGDTVHI